MLARSSRANARCSACRLLRTPAVEVRAASANQPGVGGEGAFGESRLAHRLQREGADAVEQAIANRARRAVAVDREERTAGEATDDVDRRRGGHVERLEDGLDRGKRCTAGEGGERPEASLVVGEQQLVAPSDRRLELAATGRAAAGGVAQHHEAVVQPAGDLLDRQGLGPGHGELDRQREAVE